MPPTIILDRDSILAVEELHISACGLVPGQTALFKLDCGPWSSRASFVADADGKIDVSTMAPANGDYENIDKMGLFWSMRAEPLTPLPMLTPMPDRLQLSLKVEGNLTDTRFIERFYAAPGVLCTEVRDKGLCGVLHLPPGPGPHPAILSLAGSGGGLSESTGAILASHGFAVFSLAYFNYATLQSDLCEIPLEYFGTAIEWMKAHSAIDADRLSIRGVSRGGELSLLLGSTFDAFKAVLAMVPSSVRWGSISDSVERTNRAAWTYRGQPLPFNRRSTSLTNISMDEPLSFTPDFLRAMDNKKLAEAAEIEVEKISGSVLLISGEDDAMWPSTFFSERVMQRLEKCGFPYHAQHESYPGAGHRVPLLPYQPTTPGPVLHPVIMQPVTFGGTPQADAHGALAAWRVCLDFLESRFL